MENEQENPKYLIVRNITHSSTVFEREREPGEKQEDTIAVALRPAETMALRYETWAEDNNIAKLARAGVLLVRTGNRKSAPMPELGPRPPKTKINTVDRGVVHDIVFGPDHMAESAIVVTPKVGDSRTRVNVKMLKTRNREVLETALYWIDLLGEWDKDWYTEMCNHDRMYEPIKGIPIPKRRKMIVEQIEEIDRMQMEA